MSDGGPPPPGRTVGRPEGHTAYLSDPLPPPLAWTPALVTALSGADRAGGRLAGEGRRLPHPHPVVRPFIPREAVLEILEEPTSLPSPRRR